MLRNVMIFFAFLICVSLHSQDNILYYEQGFWKDKFIQNGKELDDFEIKTLLYEKKEAYDMYKKGINQNTSSIVLLSTGSVLIISSLFTEEPTTDLILSGGGLILDIIAIIQGFKAQKSFRQATYIFNGSTKETSLKFKTTKNGVGLVMIF